jgi:hypothetical protein
VVVEQVVALLQELELQETLQLFQQLQVQVEEAEPNIKPQEITEEVQVEEEVHQVEEEQEILRQ